MKNANFIEPRVFCKIQHFHKKEHYDLIQKITSFKEQTKPTCRTQMSQPLSFDWSRELAQRTVLFRVLPVLIRHDCHISNFCSQLEMVSSDVGLDYESGIF
jgi:hypothetical protein